MSQQRTESLVRQEAVFRRQRRDSLLEIVDRSSDPIHLGLLWREVGEFQGRDGEILRAAFRANVALALPGSWEGVKVSEDLDDEAVDHYVRGLERRYSRMGWTLHSYPGLLEFVKVATRRGLKINVNAVVALVTGPTADQQRPSHIFFRALVNALPASAGGLLGAVESIDQGTSGGFRLNVLTGTLLAIKDAELGRFQEWPVRGEDSVVLMRQSVPGALAHLLHRNNLRSFDRWSLDGSTERVTATGAWLVRAVGWLADVDDHLAMRMIENLAPAIESIASSPDAQSGWGRDSDDVSQGYGCIRLKQPLLWERHGAELEAAAARVGVWKADPPDD